MALTPALDLPAAPSTPPASEEAAPDFRPPRNGPVTYGMLGLIVAVAIGAVGFVSWHSAYVDRAVDRHTAIPAHAGAVPRTEFVEVKQALHDQSAKIDRVQIDLSELKADVRALSRSRARP